MEELVKIRKSDGGKDIVSAIVFGFSSVFCKLHDSLIINTFNSINKAFSDYSQRLDYPQSTVSLNGHNVWCMCRAKRKTLKSRLKLRWHGIYTVL
jgi:hypothetical protein